MSENFSCQRRESRKSEKVRICSGRSQEGDEQEHGSSLRTQTSLPEQQEDGFLGEGEGRWTLYQLKNQVLVLISGIVRMDAGMRTAPLRMTLRDEGRSRSRR